jgi:hypothetical protein
VLLNSVMDASAQSLQMATPGPATRRREVLAGLAQKLHISGPASGGSSSTAFSLRVIA